MQNVRHIRTYIIVEQDVISLNNAQFNEIFFD